jgi:rhamnulose-1-phosphate aldolase
VKDIDREISEVSAFICNKGWAEMSAGNFSIRNEDGFIISDKSSRFRNFISSQSEYYSLMKTDFKNKQFSNSFIFDFSHIPSSEVNSHYCLQRFLNMFKQEQKVVLHTHPTHLIAFSHVVHAKNKTKINEILFSILPEVELFIPKGIGVVDLLPPGSMELAEATLSEIALHDIILWKKHGCIVCAPTLWNAVELIDVLEKAAYIYLQIKN